MFTGIIEELGTVQSLTPRATGQRLTIACREVLEDATIGCSIAINGVCLTAAELHPGAFSADVAPETLRRSNLGALLPSSPVNLERSLSPQGRLGGHFVQGHVDSTGVIESLEQLGGGDWRLTVRVPAELDPFLVEKGSIAIDGISLTIARLEGDLVSAAVIPHTFANTTLRHYHTGSQVNIEADIIAKHVAKLLGRTGSATGLSVEKLKEMGY